MTFPDCNTHLRYRAITSQCVISGGGATLKKQERLRHQFRIKNGRNYSTLSLKKLHINVPPKESKLSRDKQVRFYVVYILRRLDNFNFDVWFPFKNICS